MIEVEIKCFMTHNNSKGFPNHIGNQTIGYFRSADDAKSFLKGLVPWDFNTWYGSLSSDDFIFKNKEGKLQDNQGLLRLSKRNLIAARKTCELWPEKEK